MDLFKRSVHMFTKDVRSRAVTTDAGNGRQPHDGEARLKRLESEDTRIADAIVAIARRDATVSGVRLL